MTQKPVQIGEDLESLLREHEELKITFVDGKIKLFMLPEEAEISFTIISHGELIALDYRYNGKHVTYSV